MKNIHIDCSSIKFKCPYCGKLYIDEDEKYLKRINKNVQCYTFKKCECGNRFGISIDMTGYMVSFKFDG